MNDLNHFTNKNFHWRVVEPSCRCESSFFGWLFVQLYLCGKLEPLEFRSVLNYLLSERGLNEPPPPQKKKVFFLTTTVKSCSEFAQCHEYVA